MSTYWSSRSMIRAMSGESGTLFDPRRMTVLRHISPYQLRHATVSGPRNRSRVQDLIPRHELLVDHLIAIPENGIG